MTRLKKKKLLDDFVKFFKQKCYWMGEPVIVISYINNINKYYTIVNSEDGFTAFNIFLKKTKYWESGKCRKLELLDHINYLSINMNTKKHELLYNMYDFRILLFHLQE